MLAVLTTVLACLSPALDSAERSVQAPPQPAIGSRSATETAADGEPAEERVDDGRPAPRQDFTPSEEIGADSVVSFPVDI